MEDQDQIELDDSVTNNPMDDDELTLNDLGGKWIKNPKVGESITFTVKKFTKQTKNLVVTNPQTKKPMNTALSGTEKTGNPYKIEAITMDGAIYTISNWEQWGKLQALWRFVASEAKNPSLSPAGLTFYVKHVLSGQLQENQGKECYVVALKRPDGKYYALDNGTLKQVEVLYVSQP